MIYSPLDVIEPKNVRLVDAVVLPWRWFSSRLRPPGEPAPGGKYSRRIKIPGYALSRFAPACAQQIAGNPFPVDTIDFGARRGRIPVHTKPALNGREHARIALSSLSILQPAEVRDVCYASLTSCDLVQKIARLRRTSERNLAVMVIPYAQGS